MRAVHRRGRLRGRLGPAAAATRKTQAILPIRGKILNVEKARIDKILANKEVEAIDNELGAGMQEDFDLDKLRYHKLVLMADADVDGAHIRTPLPLTLLFRFMRPHDRRGPRVLRAAAAVPPAEQRAARAGLQRLRSATPCVTTAWPRKKLPQVNPRSSATRASAR